MTTIILTTLCAGLLAPSAWGRQSADDQALQATLTKLEKDSWEAAKKQDSGFLDGYLAADFIGIFADGLTVTKKELVQNLADFKVTSYAMEDVKLRRINPESALLLYRLNYDGLVGGKPTKVDGIRSSSLYVLRSGKWLEVFYQETEIRKK